jgi:hypothetical protein
MDRYQRVEKPRPETQINENEIRITTQGRMRNYITYATTLLQVQNLSLSLSLSLSIPLWTPIFSCICENTDIVSYYICSNHAVLLDSLVFAILLKKCVYGLKLWSCWYALLGNGSLFTLYLVAF